MRRSENMTFLGRGNREVWCGTWQTNKQKQQNNSSSVKWDFLLKIFQPAFRAECAPGIHSPLSKGVTLWIQQGAGASWHLEPVLQDFGTCVLLLNKWNQPNPNKPNPTQTKLTKTKANNSKHVKESKRNNFYQLIRPGSSTFWGHQRKLPRMVKKEEAF